MAFYLAYGSNLNFNQMKFRCPRAKPLFNINGKIIAWDNRCPHRGASLADGNINNDTVQCKYHLWEFDFKRACSTANENIKVKKFKISVIENDIFIC